MTLDDRGVRPLTARERRILARLEQSLTGRPREAAPPGPPGPTGDVAMHRADRVAAVVGLLILCGMTAEAAIAGGPVLGLAVGIAFVIMVLVFVRVVRCRR
ncbi:hypothetical protein GCM10010472_60500 [Pseudonocardia halophobica]|uniref:DUF3040 domain-containing protein n=1 Tax=Pseudonocardia halophobica TaxID=29401 RepID=A0A9W6UG45_9PSEU|nr:hypothetical protein [Pseudonocardia halophobica]GLL15996.1 hypothetical protein GCM10017577_71500 [Pseudonocardia halophobica]